MTTVNRIGKYSLFGLTFFTRSSPPDSNDYDVTSQPMQWYKFCFAARIIRCYSSLFACIHTVTIIHGTKSPKFHGPSESLDFNFRSCGPPFEKNLYILLFFVIATVLSKVFCRDKATSPCNSDRVIFCFFNKSHLT